MKKKKKIRLLQHEIDEYSRSGAEVSLRGSLCQPSKIACTVAESGDYMRDYEFSSTGSLKRVNFVPLKPN